MAHLALAPLVGRRRELELLVAALVRARGERSPEVVTLVGPAGIGKSRLVHELMGLVEADDELISWRQGRSLPYGDSVAHLALAEIVRAQAGILDTDETAAHAAKLDAAVDALLPERAEAEWVQSHLRPLAGLGGGVELRGDRRADAFAAWRRFFEALAAERPLVLVFEDVQWADDGLLDFVEHLVAWSAPVPLLVVCTARPELLDRRPEWAPTVVLDALADDERRRCSTSSCSIRSSPTCARRSWSAQAAIRSTLSSSRGCSTSAGPATPCRSLRPSRISSPRGSTRSGSRRRRCSRTPP